MQFGGGCEIQLTSENVGVKSSDSLESQNSMCNFSYSFQGSGCTSMDSTNCGSGGKY